MHDTALALGKEFFDSYLANGMGKTIVEIGSRDVNGSLREVAPAGNNYIGVDFEKGKGVDVILTDPYSLPFEDNSVDLCVCSSCFEHSEFFWLLFGEILRILKPAGLFFLNAPSNGLIHRFPVDCWRFYPDSGVALQNWGRRIGFECALLESFTGLQGPDAWNDFIAVFVKDRQYAERYPTRIQHTYKRYMNGLTIENLHFANPTNIAEDQNAHLRLNTILDLIGKVMSK